jgi:hypothetical protein
MKIWKGWWNQFQKYNCFTLPKHRNTIYTLWLLWAASLYSINTLSAQVARSDSTNFDTVITGKKIKFATDSIRTTIVYADSASFTKDSTTANGKKKEKRHSPLKAALFSAALPGLGQGYNKKYWKIPIVYAGFAGLGYAVYYTATGFYGYRNAYRLQVDKNPDTYGSYKGIDDAATLKTYRDYFKKNLDMTAIFTAVWYTLNIVDAAVDAHLFEWNMKDDLSVSWRPVFVNPVLNSNTACLGLGIQLKM